MHGENLKLKYIKVCSDISCTGRMRVSVDDNNNNVCCFLGCCVSNWECVVLKFNACVSCLGEACYLFTTVQDKTNKNSPHNGSFM